MIRFDLEPGRIRLVAGPKTALVELAAALDFGFCWFLGRGVYLFNVTRLKDKGGGIKLNMKGLCPPRPLVFGSCAVLGGLLKDGYFPRMLRADEKWHPGGRLDAMDGQNRLGALLQEHATTVQTETDDQDTTVATYAFALADMTVGYFALGASVVEWRCSLKLQQVSFDTGLPASYVRYCSSRAYAYRPTTTVDSLR